MPRRRGYLPPELLQLPPSLQPRALHLLQPGPQVPGLLAHGHPRLFEERQFLLLVLTGQLQAEKGRGQRQPGFGEEYSVALPQSPSPLFLEWVRLALGLKVPQVLLAHVALS